MKILIKIYMENMYPIEVTEGLIEEYKDDSRMLNQMHIELSEIATYLIRRNQLEMSS